MTSPGRAGRTSRGVTMMARSVSFFWYEALRNSAPSTGTSPSQGNCEIAFWPLLCSRPPITKLWPSRSSTVVEARRTISGGTRDAGRSCTVWLMSSWLTSGSIFRLIRPPLSTVGVKARPTP